MSRRSAEAHLRVLMALKQRLKANNVTITMLEPIGSCLLVYEGKPTLRNTGKRTLEMHIEVPCRGPILIKNMNAPGGLVPMDMVLEMHTHLCSAWTTIGGMIGDI